MNKILCIVAHPDDEALGLGGTLIKHSDKGDEVNIFIFSDGEGAKKNPKDKNVYRIQSAKNWANETNTKIYKKMFNGTRLEIHKKTVKFIFNKLEYLV